MGGETHRAAAAGLHVPIAPSTSPLLPSPLLSHPLVIPAPTRHSRAPLPVIPAQAGTAGAGSANTPYSSGQVRKGPPIGTWASSM